MFHWISQFGGTFEIHSNQGRYLEKEIYDILGMKKTKTTPIHPHLDCMVERPKTTLQDNLRIVNDEDWSNWTN